MLVNIVTGCLLVILTTFVHAVVMVGALRGLRIMRARRWARASGLTRATVVATLVVVMFLASVIEAGMWAATYRAVGALTDLEPALYFSVVTYTTLGYGDVVLPERWRLLASFEAANGIMTFGWTTALIVATVQRVYVAHRPTTKARLDV